MNKNTIALAASGVLALSGSLMANTVLLTDSFDTEHGGVGILNYDTFTNWRVVPGTVDLLGNGFNDYNPGHGLYIDMNGAQISAGTLTSATTWNFSSAQTYRIEFDLAASQRNLTGDSVIFLIEAGNVAIEASPTLGHLFKHYRFDFTGDDTAGALRFSALGGGQIGLLMDNITLSQVTLVPIPQAAGTGLIGLIGVASLAIARRRQHRR